MTFNEVLDKYRQMPTAKRRLILMMPAALFLFALMTAPHSPSVARDAGTATASAVSDCAVTKMRMGIFGRSLIAYDWQSGNCFNAAARRTNQ
jgi:hypothetical protein